MTDTDRMKNKIAELKEKEREIRELRQALEASLKLIEASKPK